jgi:hypothetical protein
MVLSAVAYKWSSVVTSIIQKFPLLNLSLLQVLTFSEMSNTVTIENDNALYISKS